MKPLICLLTLLLALAQFDDCWAAAPPSDSPAADNDEYLPAQRRPREQRPSSRHRPAPGAATLRQAAPSEVSGGVPPGPGLTTPFAPPPLYVFMSLQI